MTTLVLSGVFTPDYTRLQVFLNGLKISDLDLFILALIFRFEVIYVQKTEHKV